MRPTTTVRQFQGNARQIGWGYQWVMPAVINQGPRRMRWKPYLGELPTERHSRFMHLLKRQVLHIHRHIKHLMAPNCRGGHR